MPSEPIEKRHLPFGLELKPQTWRDLVLRFVAALVIALALVATGIIVLIASFPGQD